MNSWKTKATVWFADVLKRFSFRVASEQRDIPPQNDEISRWVDEGGSGSDPRRPTPAQRGGDAH